jgi:excisionase family DNA binding protein
MQARTTVPERGGQRKRNNDKQPAKDPKVKLTPATIQPPAGQHNLRRHPRPHTLPKASGRTGAGKPRRAFSELIDAKAASKLLGVPYTWLLAQARERKIPHHRLGHYVRFDPDDLQAWLREGRIGADGERPRARRDTTSTVRDVA